MTPELCIYEGIGIDPETNTGMTAKAFNDALKALGAASAITLRINSPGGSVTDGMAIYGMIKSSRARITARIEGIAASAASLIAMACDRIEIAENAFMLVHEPYTSMTGSADDLATAAGDLELMTNQYASIYSARTGMDPDDVLALMKEDRLMSAQEAVERGFADAIAASGPEANAKRLAKKHRRIIAARGRRDNGWDTAIALATGKRKPVLQRDRAVNALWERAINSVKAESTDTAGSGWDKAIAKLGKR